MKINLYQKVSASIALMAVLVLFSGCPYSSNVPIDEGTVKISPSLSGQWMSTDDQESEHPTIYVIIINDMFHATAKKMEYSTSDSTYSEIVYHLTLSDVGGDVFMNLKEDESSTYNIFKFNFDEKKGEITTSEVTDYIKETFDTSKDLKEFIAKNKSNSYFFTNTTETYIRKPKD